MTAHAMYQTPRLDPVRGEAAPIDGRVTAGQQFDGGFVVDIATAMRRTVVRGGVVLAMVAVALFLFFSASVQAGDALRATDTHVVGQGETLWAIAEDFTTPGDDVRATIIDIKELNDMTSSIVRVGQPLIVPASD